MTSLLDDISRIYQHSCVGGALHIVLDDGNVEDEHILYCKETCHKHWSTNNEAISNLVISVCDQLLALPVEVREELYERRWARLLS